MVSETSIVVKPEVMLVDDVLDDVAAGRLRVPRFQRPFVWRPEQMVDLFDSIERGFPIGSLLVWETDEVLATTDTVGGLPIPSPTSSSGVAYVLDGHQRLSTLYGVLRRPSELPDVSENAEWIWRVYRELGSSDPRSNLFTHWRYSRSVPSHLLPMRSVLRTMDFLAFARALESSGERLPQPADQLVEEAEALAQRIKSYKLAVIRLIGGTLEQAVEVFSRLNSRGQAMTPDQMVSALTYTSSGELSLAEKINSILESLGPHGYSTIPRSSVFRAILAVAGEGDIQNARWETLARRLGPQLDDALERTEYALQTAVTFLRESIGVPLGRLLPYSIQLVLLAAFFDGDPAPSDQKRDTLRRWFWATSWNGYFAGANTTQIKNALAEMRQFASGGASQLEATAETARPFPERFDMRSARVRTLILWQLRDLKPTALDGQPLDVVDIVEKADTDAYRHVIPEGTELVSSPANRIVLPTPPGVSVRRALSELPLASTLPASHGIPDEAMVALRDGDADAFIRLRSEHMASLERAFMTAIGITAPPTDFGPDVLDAE